MALLGVSGLTEALVVLAAALGLALYAALRHKMQYWTRKGVPQVEPSLLFGNFKESTLGRRRMLQDVTAVYNQMRGHKYCGLYQMQRPILLIRDPDLAKIVLTKDFSSFASRGQAFDQENDPLSGHLFNLDGQLWKALRSKLSPTFTSGKLKLMFPHIKECVDELVSVVRAEKDVGDVNMKEFLGRFAVDVIGTCAFGIQCNSLKNPDAEFYQVSRRLFRPSIFFQLRLALATYSPFLANLLIPFKLMFPDTTSFFINLMKETVGYRLKNNVVRNDFVDLIIGIRKAEKEGDIGFPEGVTFSDALMTAQAFVFFAAGLENVVNPVGFSLHELALNQDVQDKLAAEVRRVLAKHNGQLTYESVKDMEYLGWVLDEVTRMYNPVAALFRTVTVPKYDFPDSDLTLQEGDTVFVATEGMMMDPTYFPDPERFDPERFSEENKSTRHPYTYLPFGEGPRFCIAERFAKLEMRIALAALVNEFQFHVGPSTVVPIEFIAKTFSPSPVHGFPLKVTSRRK